MDCLHFGFQKQERRGYHHYQQLHFETEPLKKGEFQVEGVLANIPGNQRAQLAGDIAGTTTFRKVPQTPDSALDRFVDINGDPEVFSLGIIEYLLAVIKGISGPDKSR